MPLSVAVRGLGGAPSPTPTPPPTATGQTFYLWDTGVGQVQLQTTQPGSTKSQSITVGASVESYIMTDGRQAAYLGHPGVAGNYGDAYTATVKVTATFASAWMRVSLEQNGVFIAGGWGGWQAIGSTGTYTFTLIDNPDTAWATTDTLQLFIDVRNTGSGSGTVTWEVGGPTETLVTPFPSVAAPPPPPPSGTINFNGKASQMSELVSYEVPAGTAGAIGPITWPDGSIHYFYHHQTPVVWGGCLCFIKNDISLQPDSRYSQVYKSTVTIGDTNPWHGSAGGVINGAGQLSEKRPTNLGSWSWFAHALKVNAWNGSPTDLSFADITSYGYQTSSNSQVALRVANSGGNLWWQMFSNAGYASGPIGRATGTTHYEEVVIPVVFGQWEEFIVGIKQATDKTGAVELHHRVPGGTWSKIWSKTNVDTELYGTIYQADGTTLYRTFAQDGSNWTETLDKMGLYFGLISQTIVTQTVYNSGFVTCADLATAKATFPA